ncbi:MAG TPA: hypothetical protein VMI54_21835, partial [Polyangiaceae bacterium]|nr:hypothetical protein [Polyangiaceae bacterium]
MRWSDGVTQRLVRAAARRRVPALLACRDNAARETVLFGSFASARLVARLRRGEGSCSPPSACPASYARSADSRALALVLPGAGGASGTP